MRHRPVTNAVTLRDGNDTSRSSTGRLQARALHYDVAINPTTGKPAACDRLVQRAPPRSCRLATARRSRRAARSARRRRRGTAGAGRSPRRRAVHQRVEFLVQAARPECDPFMLTSISCRPKSRSSSVTDFAAILRSLVVGPHSQSATCASRASSASIVSLCAREQSRPRGQVALGGQIVAAGLDPRIERTLEACVWLSPPDGQTHPVGAGHDHRSVGAIPDFESSLGRVWTRPDSACSRRSG